MTSTPSIFTAALSCLIFATSVVSLGCDRTDDAARSQAATKGWSTQKLEQKLKEAHYKVEADPQQRTFSQMHWDLRWEHPIARLDEPRSHSYMVKKGNVSTYLFAAFYDSEQEAKEAMAAVTAGKNEQEAAKLNLGAVRDKNAVFVAIPWDPLPLVSGDTTHVKAAMGILNKIAGKAPEVDPMPRIEKELAEKKAKAGQ